jgi:ribonuclease P protein component
MPVRLRLGRLRSSADFGRVKQEGQYWSSRRCAVNAARQPTPDTQGNTVQAVTRVGFITSKRIGNAVQRNRARRLLRESMRALGPMIEPCWDIVVIAHPPIATLGVHMQDVRDELQWLLKRAHLIQTG